MTDREKVIKGLECCILRNPDDHARCSQCSYGGNCVNRLKMDALALLKAQEPRVMTLEEVKAAKDDDIYLEISTRTDEIPYITAATLDGVGIKGVTFYCSHFDFVAYNRRLYGWRCWAARPTDDQRKAVKWDDA